MINRHKKKLQWALLLCVVLALVAYAVYSQFLVVTPFYNKFDPEIPYLLNALGIFEGHAYHYADHPGTPINLAGTLLFLLLNPLALFSQADFSYDVLLHPERFLLVARLLVSALNILAVIFLWRFSRDKVSLPGLTFILTSYFIGFGPGSWTATVYWSHNAFCFALGTAFLFLTYRTLSSDSPRTGQRLAWLGAGAGFLLSIQLYFVAWVVGLLAIVFFLLLLERQSWWAYITAGGAVVGGTLASYLVVNLPVLHRFPYMFAWFGRLITTLGKYDEGEAGVLSLSVLWKSFLDYQGNGFSLLFIMVGLLLLGFAVLALRRGNFTQDKVLWAMTAGISVQTLLACLLVLKQVGTIYLASVAALLPMLFFLWFRLYQPRNKWWRAFYPAIAWAMLIIFAWELGFSILHVNVEKELFESRNATADAYLVDYAAQQNMAKDDLHVFSGYFIATDWCNPYWFSNEFANWTHTETIQRICPHMNYWDDWRRAFLVGDDYIDFADYDDWDVVFVYSAFKDSVEFFDDAGATVEPLGYSLVAVTP